MIVFAASFLAFVAGGILYVYSRPAEYRAGARLEIIPAERLLSESSAAGAAGSDTDSAFLTEVQLLTARPALEELAHRLRRTPFSDSLSGGHDPVSALQKMLSVQPVKGTRVVQLWATAETPGILPLVLDELMSIYQTQLRARFTGDFTEATEQAREEVVKYKSAVLQKRAEMEDFRNRSGIVSPEREDNEMMVRARNLNTALNAAEEKALQAQTRLNALRAALAEGRAPVRAKDNATLAGLEQRLSQAREEFKQLQRRYTTAYLAREPQAVALKARIPELEEQIRREREASQKANLAEAEYEAAQTQEALRRLRKQLSGEKQMIQAFAARMGEYKALQTQLEALERLHDGANQRLVKLEAQEKARKPRVQIIQSAILPSEPWRPHYTRDAGVAVLSALVLAWLAAWLTDFLLAPEPSSPAVIVASMPVTYPAAAPEISRIPQPAIRASAALDRLPAPPLAPRELEETEISALLEAADDEARVALVALFCGVSPEEMVELKWENLDLAANVIRTVAPAARAISIGPEMMGFFAAARQRQGAGPGQWVLRGPAGEPAQRSHLEAIISYAAHDAGLAQPAEINPAVIRHTLLAFLVRQGIRFSELARIVGPLPADVTAAYGALVPSIPRRSLEETDRVIPALRSFIHGAGTQAKT